MPSTIAPAPSTTPAFAAPGPAPDAAPRSPLLARLTSLTTVTMVTAAGILIVGILAVFGGGYAKDVVHDQLAPQQIFFPAKGSPELLPGVKQYAGQQLVNGSQAKAYANEFIGVHLKKIAGGKTYAQVSTAAMADPKNEALAGQKAALFQGETLRGLLLSGWGWSVVGTIATLAGWLLIALGSVLFLLPALNWQRNLRRGAPAA
jgi:hypothetical protein